MNPIWKQFLLSENAVFSSDTDIGFPTQTPQGQNLICPIPYLGALTLSGVDAAKLLQGQITCNINDVNENKSSLGALCNPKGRVITTFLLIKSLDRFILLMPLALLEVVRKRLQMYVLRSDVSIHDSSAEFCVLGIQTGTAVPDGHFRTSQQPSISVSLPSATGRFLIIAEADPSISLWRSYVHGQGYTPAGSAHWRYLDMLSGIPWLDPATSEEYIPQMLNLDKLGGISFTKGCYTGQEIVARTHYLGQAKREMYLAESDAETAPEANTNIIAANQGVFQTVGKVLAAQIQNGVCKMLIVMQNSDSNNQQLKLDNQNQNSIILLAL